MTEMIDKTSKEPFLESRKFGGGSGAPQGRWVDRDIFRMCFPYSSTDSGRIKKFLSPDSIEKNV